MEENTLELSFEVDVSEGDEEKDRNYSLDSDNDDGDLGDFDPEAGENQDAAVGGALPVQPAAYLHEPAGPARDCWMMIKVYIQEEITFPSQTYQIRHN